MKNQKNKSSNRGFTFIEVLIAIAVYAVIALSLFTAFHAGVRLWKNSDEQMQENQRLRFLLTNFSADLRNALNCSTDPPAPRYQFVGESQKIAFMTLRDESFGFVTRRALAKVVYEIDPDKHALLRRVATRQEGFDEQFAKPIQILEGVEPLYFSYAYQSETEGVFSWQPVWKNKANNLPKGVKLRAGAYEQTVLVPTGDLRKWTDEEQS